MRKRMRVVIHERSPEYYHLRFFWLHELRQLRAKRRISGANIKTERKKAQRELAKLRRTL